MMSPRTLAAKLPPYWRNTIAATHDTCMAGASFVLALWLRLGSENLGTTTSYLLPGTLAFMAIAAVVFVSLRLYRGLWRYASLPDLVALTRAATIAVVIFSLLLFFVNRLEGVPRSVPVIQWMILLLLLGGPRFVYRALKDRTLHFDFTHDARLQVPLLLVGATTAAELFIRECRRQARAPYRVVGIVDDRPELQHRMLLGVRIYGRVEDLPVVVNKLARRSHKPQRLVLAEEYDGKHTARLLEMADRLGLTLARLPSRSELKDGAAARAPIRSVALEDLLGRAQNVHDRHSMRALVEGKAVAITGAGGSIGAELARQIAALSPAHLLLMDQSEYALYLIDRELAELTPSLPRTPLLVDVRQRGMVEDVFAVHRPSLVFHAAALKHVPLSEANPLEAISTNVLGTRHVADACVRHGTEAMVLISTDKAVHPASVMGATKRLSERYLQVLGSHSACRMISVRFGNVLGSTGSVVPLFEQQIKKGGPLTVTHPDMVRYFMTVREAVELVIQSAAMGMQTPTRTAPVYVLDMGTPVRIVDLATQMIRLSGLRPGHDIDIAYTGLRPGEKLFEELFYDARDVSRTSQAGILLARETLTVDDLTKPLITLEHHCTERNTVAALALLRTLVPEYRIQEETAA